MKRFRVIQILMFAFLIVLSACNNGDDQIVDPNTVNPSEDNNDGSGTSQGGNEEDSIQTDKSLQNISIDTVLVNENLSSIAIVWGKTEDGVLGVQIEYKDDISGIEKEVEVNLSKDTTFIEGVKLGELVKYRTSYSPKKEGVTKLYASLENIVYVMKMNQSKWSGKPLPNDPPMTDDYNTPQNLDSRLRCKKHLNLHNYEQKKAS